MLCMAAELRGGTRRHMSRSILRHAARLELTFPSAHWNFPLIGSVEPQLPTIQPGGDSRSFTVGGNCALHRALTHACCIFAWCHSTAKLTTCNNRPKFRYCSAKNTEQAKVTCSANGSCNSR